MDDLDNPEKDSIQQFAARLRSKAGDAYQDIDDHELVDKFVRKNPVYADRVDLPGNFKLLNTSTGYKNLDDVYEKAGRENNVDPNLLLEQGRTETIDFKPDVMYGRQNSPKGARGAGQFMPGSGPTYGLTVNDTQDDRTDPIKSIHAQAKYMRKLLDQFDNNEDLALAGYNAGEYRDSLKKGQIPDIPETQKYVKDITGRLVKVRAGQSPLKSLIGNQQSDQSSPTVATTQTIQSGGEMGMVAPQPVLNDSQLPAYAGTVDDMKGLPIKTGVPNVQPNTTVQGVQTLPGIQPTAYDSSVPFTVPLDDTLVPPVNRNAPAVAVNKQSGEKLPVTAKTPVVQQVNQPVNQQTTQPVQQNQSADAQDINPATGKPYQYGSEVSTNTDQFTPILSREQQIAVDAQTNQRQQNDYEYSQWLKNKGLSDSTENFNKFNRQKSDTQKLSLPSQNIDLSDYTGTDPARELAFRALKQAFGDKVTDNEINMALDIEKAKGGYTRDNSGGNLDNSIVEHFNSGDKNFDYIPQYEQLQNILNRRQGKEEFKPSTPDETFTRDLKEKYQPTDEQLRQRAIDEINSENRHNLVNNFAGQKDLTEDNIKSVEDRIKATLPDEKLFNEALKIGQKYQNTPGESGWANSLAFMDYAAAGLAKIPTLGYDNAVSSSLARSGSFQQAIGEMTGRDKSNSAWIINQLTGLPINLLTIGAFAKIPGGPIVQFSALNAAETSGRGASRQQVLSSAAEGAVTGAIMHSAPVAGEIISSDLPIFKPIAEVGAVGTGTLIQNAGGDKQDAIRNALMMGAFHTFGLAKEQFLGKTGRVYKDGQSLDLSVDENGKVSEGVIAGGKPDFNIILDPGNENTIEAVKQNAEQPSNKIEVGAKVTTPKGDGTIVSIKGQKVTIDTGGEHPVMVRMPDVQLQSLEPNIQNQPEGKDTLGPESKPEDVQQPEVKQIVTTGDQESGKPSQSVSQGQSFTDESAFHEFINQLTPEANAELQKNHQFFEVSDKQIVAVPNEKMNELGLKDADDVDKYVKENGLDKLLGTEEVSQPPSESNNNAAPNENFTTGARVKTKLGDEGTVLKTETNFRGETQVQVKYDKNGNEVWLPKENLSPLETEAIKPNEEPQQNEQIKGQAETGLQSNESDSNPQDTFYNQIRGKDQKDYKQKVEFLDGYKSLEDERNKRLDQLATENPESDNYKQIDKRIGEIDRALQLQVEQGAKHFNIEPNDFISVVNDYFEDKTGTKQRLLPETRETLPPIEAKNDSNITNPTPTEGGTNDNGKLPEQSNNLGETGTANNPTDTNGNTERSDVATSSDNSGKSPTSTKNEIVDEERSSRGLEPIMPEARREFGQVWDEAIKEIDKNPNVAKDLVEHLKNNPRSVSDKENALLLHHKITLNNEFDKASQNLIDAFDSGDTAKQAEARQEVARLSDERNALDEVTKRAGTESARGLVARKMLAKEDYSLASLEQQKRAANGGRPLTDTEHKQLVEVQKKLEETQKAFDEYRQNENNRIARNEASRKIRDLNHEVSDPALKAVRDLAQRITNKLEARAEAARERRIKRGTAQGTQLQAGFDPADIKDLAEIGAYEIAKYGNDFTDWSTRMLSEVNDLTEAALKKIYDAANKIIDRTIGNPKVRENVKKGTEAATKEAADVQGKLIEDIKDKYSSGDITLPVQKLAKEYIKQDIKGLDPLIDKVHDVLKEIDPDATRREAMDAISGYGKFKQLSKDTISQTLSDLKGQMRQLAKLEDIAEGRQPAKSGLERRKMSDEEKKLADRVKEAQGKTSIPIETVKKNLQNRIDSLEKAIKDKAPIEKSNRPSPTSPEIETLKTRRDELQKIYDETFPKNEKKPLTDEQRLKNYKKSIQKRTDELQTKLDNKDFSRPERRTLTLDPEGTKLKVAHERVLRQFQQELAKDKAKNLPLWERTLNTLNKVRRFEVLSGLSTYGKLGAAAVENIAVKPIEEIAGAVLGRLPVLNRVAAKAGSEGVQPIGQAVMTEAKVFASIFTHGFKDAFDTMRTGQSDLDIQFGKNAHEKSWLEFNGTMHQVIKSPPVRAAFTRSYEKRMAMAIQNGLKVTDPLVQSAIGFEAYQDAQRSIFKGKNIATDSYGDFVKNLERRDKNDKVNPAGKLAAFTLREILPVVKIPVNFAKEAFNYSGGGLGVGTARLARAMYHGFDTLQPAEADAILRSFKKGAIGMFGGVMLGYFHPGNFGGLNYDKNRDGKDVPEGRIRLFGYDIPRIFTHHPLIEAMQVGASIRRLQDTNFKRSDPQAQSFWNAFLKTGLNVTEEIPFVKEMIDTSKVFDDNKRGSVINDNIKSFVVPQILQNVANQTDTKSGSVFGEPNKRKPESVWQSIESGIPGLRQNVPLKPAEKQNIANDVRSGKLTQAEAQSELQRQREAGDISGKKQKAQNRDMTLNESQKEIKTAHLESENDIQKIENIIINTPDADKPSLQQSLQKKIMSARRQQTNQGRQNADALQNLYNKYFK